MLRTQAQRLCLLCVFALLWTSGAFALPPREGECTAIVTVAIVCTQWNCESTAYVDNYWCNRTPRTDITPLVNNPADTDLDLKIDHFQGVVETDDPCAWQFDNGDRLGSAQGGANTSRPNHLGVDIQADYGDNVAAVGHGQITRAGWHRPGNPNSGCGYMITIRHPNGDQSSYCHLVPDSPWQVGDWVRAGAVVGRADSTGNSSGHHLHLVYKESSGNYIEYWESSGSMVKPTTSDLNGGC